ncbi:unnamed protein product [Microthlaspi erraticum]|uniref:UAS domain-containing protein n=1 Tax=Microthlaspi erraticum TaxID=1685480 RepID=A0A6D2IK91_9BRAS|nr:unnamed protein product [Microthlaspi erraticum]
MKSAKSANHQNLISSFVEIAVGETKAYATRFLKSTSWDLEEAINLYFMIRGHNDTQDKLCPPANWDSNKPEPSDSALGGSGLSLSSLFRPPLKLLFQGSFEEARSTSCWKNQWLLVNLQSTTEFASHALNRDLWSNEAVSQATESSFVLCQVYDDTAEGQKISTLYKIETAPPVVLLIDPITCEKMRSWSGAIEAQGYDVHRCCRASSRTLCFSDKKKRTTFFFN